MAEALVVILLVTLPAIFNPFGGQPIDPIKASLLRSAAALIAAAWVASRLARPASAANVAANPVVKAGLLVLAATSASTLLSINPAASFFGSYFREMGWLTTAAGVVLLVVGADLWSEPARRERAVTAVLAGALLPGAYAWCSSSATTPCRGATWTARATGRCWRPLSWRGWSGTWPRCPSRSRRW